MLYIAQFQAQSQAPVTPVNEPQFSFGDFMAVGGSVAAGLIGWMAKRLYHDLEEKIKSLGGEVEKLKAADILRSEEIKEVKLEMVSNYVTRQDFVHSFGLLDAKLDTLGENMKKVAIQMEVDRELRQVQGYQAVTLRKGDQSS